MNSSESILKQKSYFSPSRYISGRIIEYDIKSANISILRQSNYIDESYYRYLFQMPKFDREKEIGLLIQSDKRYYDVTSEGISKYKVLLGSHNSIQIQEIVRVANDAVYINRSKDLVYTKFDDYIEFKQKTIFNVSLVLLGKIIIFCKFNTDGTLDIDVKGLGKNQYYHQDYMLTTIATVIHLAERSSLEDALNFLSRFIDDYIHLNLDVGYYREFDDQSFFRLKYYDKNINFGILNSMSLNPDDLDINRNLLVLRDLWSIILELYNIRNR